MQFPRPPLKHPSQPPVRGLGRGAIGPTSQAQNLRVWGRGQGPWAPGPLPQNTTTNL
jgi:hypothetical protein